MRAVAAEGEKRVLITGCTIVEPSTDRHVATPTNIDMFSSSTISGELLTSLAREVRTLCRARAIPVTTSVCQLFTHLLFSLQWIILFWKFAFQSQMSAELLLSPVQRKYGFEKAGVLDTAADVYNAMLPSGPSDEISSIKITCGR